MNDNWLDKVNWTQDGLVPAVAQESRRPGADGRVDEPRGARAGRRQTGEAHYWSRSRRKLWRKGEESGHVQKVRSIRLDCDEDVILLEVEQVGGIACHTGRQAAFSSKLDGGRWVAVDPVLKDPTEIYRRKCHSGH